MATAKDIEEIIGISDNTIETWSRGADSKALLSKFLKSFSKQYLQEKVEAILEQECIKKITLEELIKDISNNSEKLFSSGSFELVYSSCFKLALPNRSTLGPDLLLFNKNTNSAITIYITSLIPSRNNLMKKIHKDIVFSIEALTTLSKLDPNSIQSIEYIIISKSKLPEDIDFQHIPDMPIYLNSIIHKDVKIDKEDLEKALKKTTLKGMKINAVASTLYDNENLIIV